MVPRHTSPAFPLFGKDFFSRKTHPVKATSCLVFAHVEFSVTPWSKWKVIQSFMCDVTHSFMYAHSRGNDVNMLARCDSVPRCICVGYVSLSFWVSCAKEPYLSATLSQQRKCILWTEKVWFMEPPIVAMCRMCHTDMCHTDMCHRDVSHRYVSHRYCHTDICHTDMCHTDTCHRDVSHRYVSHRYVSQIYFTQIYVTQICVTQMYVAQIYVTRTSYISLYVSHRYVSHRCVSHRCESHRYVSHS